MTISVISGCLTPLSVTSRFPSSSLVKLLILLYRDSSVSDVCLALTCIVTVLLTISSGIYSLIALVLTTLIVVVKLVSVLNSHTTSLRGSVNSLTA